MSTGLRGSESITPKLVTLEALDHDIHKSPLTPNVALRCNIPASTDKSFVRGYNYYTVSDSIFQSSSPFRHGVILCKIIKELEHVPPILMKYTDVGTDQRNTLVSFNVASIYLFKELDLDFMIAVRRGPGHSCMNPVDRIMSILNLGLQNVATERAPCDDESIEKKVKKCNSMTELQELDEKVFGVEEAWLNSVDKAKRIISERFSWMSLKEVPLTEFGCVSDYEIEHFKRHVNQLFPGISMDKLQKTHVREIQSYVSWKKKHFKEEHYALQINLPDTISKTAGTLLYAPYSNVQ